MYDGYLSFNGVELINADRTSAYLKALVPGLKVDCTAATLHTALGQGTYTTPTRDRAPWFRGQRASAGRFYGLFPGKLEGADDSTRQVPVVELTRDGAVHTMPRHASREIRVVATAFAADEEAMNEGMAWLRNTLNSDGCGNDVGFGCTGHDLKLFSAMPKSRVDAATMARMFYSVETLTGPAVNNKTVSAHAKVIAWEVEFVFSAGRPWAFTPLAAAANLNMDKASAWTDPTWENCSDVDSAYDAFVNDPYFTAISKPPRPPAIMPPNLLEIDSWRRKAATLPASTTTRWGRVVPVVRVVTGSTSTKQIRIRFYKTSGPAYGCGFDGEFLVSYVPAHSTLTIDGARQSITVHLPDGRTVPGGHLLYGSDGRPFTWPSMGCQNGYIMTVDMLPGQSGVVVLLDTAVRE